MTRSYRRAVVERSADTGPLGWRNPGSAFCSSNRHSPARSGPRVIVTPHVTRAPDACRARVVPRSCPLRMACPRGTESAFSHQPVGSSGIPEREHTHRADCQARPNLATVGTETRSIGRDSGRARSPAARDPLIPGRSTLRRTMREVDRAQFTEAIGTSTDNSNRGEFQRRAPRRRCGLRRQAVAYRAVFRWANRYDTPNAPLPYRPHHSELIRERLLGYPLRYSRRSEIAQRHVPASAVAPPERDSARICNGQINVSVSPHVQSRKGQASLPDPVSKDPMSTVFRWRRIPRRRLGQ